MKSPSIAIVSLLVVFNHAVAGAELPSSFAPSTKATISIFLDGVAKDTHWAVGIHQGSNAGIGVKVAQVAALEELLAERNFIGDGSDMAFPLGALRLTDSEVHLTAGSGGKSPYVDVSMPSEKTVNLYVNGSLIYAGTQGGPIGIVDGVTVAYKAGGANLIGMLRLPSTIESEIGGDIRAGTGNVATNAGLRRHIIKQPAPLGGALDSFSLPDNNGTMRIMNVQITIDITGTVVLADPVGSRQADPFAKLASASLLQAKFKAFEHNGSPVQVTAIVGCALQSGGIVSFTFDR